MVEIEQNHQNLKRSVRGGRLKEKEKKNVQNQG
jgi:hypothetical protein